MCRYHCQGDGTRRQGKPSYSTHAGHIIPFIAVNVLSHVNLVNSFKESQLLELTSWLNNSFKEDSDFNP